MQFQQVDYLHHFNNQPMGKYIQEGEILEAATHWIQLKYTIYLKNAGPIMLNLKIMDNSIQIHQQSHRITIFATNKTELKTMNNLMSELKQGEEYKANINILKTKQTQQQYNQYINPQILTNHKGKQMMEDIQPIK